MQEIITNSKPIHLNEAMNEAKMLKMKYDLGILDSSNMPSKKIKAIADEKIVNRIVIHEDNTMWYYGPWGNAQRYDTVVKRNRNRMYVNGKYIPVSHPFHTAGRYVWDKTALDSFNTLSNIELVNIDTSGEIYIIENPLFEGWVKVGMAIDSKKRLKDYFTYTPQKNEESYKLIHTIEVKNRMVAESEIHNQLESECNRIKEWFQISSERAKEIVSGYEADF